MPAERPDYDAVIETPVVSVHLGIVTDQQALSAIEFLTARHRTRHPQSDITCESVRQLRAYFDDPRWQFSLPLIKQGTPFQQRVWQQLRSIPTGETRSYGDVAQQLKSVPRAVGGACRRNPVPLVVPCHRVVAADGIGGFCGETAGDKLDFKQWLLDHERG